MGASGSCYDQKLVENAEKIRKEMNLHFCGWYNNLVRFDKKLCEGCPYNGLRQAKTRV